MQASDSVLRGCVEVAPVFQQQLQYVQVATMTCIMNRSKIVILLDISQLPLHFSNLFDQFTFILQDLLIPILRIYLQACFLFSFLIFSRLLLFLIRSYRNLISLML